MKRSASCLNSQHFRQIQPLRIEDNPRSGANQDTAHCANSLSFSRAGLSLGSVNKTWHRWLPWIFVALVALSRWPGLFPPNFSAATALAFCAGVYLSGAMAWWLPLGTMAATDVALNVFYYHTPPVGGYLLLNYLVYAVLIWFGRQMGRRASFLKLLAGGLLGAMAFYLITNTLAWLENPVYARTLAGWIQALTSGQPGFPPTWEFFRNTLLSGGLFTALFVAAMKLTAPAESPVEKEAGARPEAGNRGRTGGSESMTVTSRRVECRDFKTAVRAPSFPVTRHPSQVTGHFMEIGVISDTHNFLDPKIPERFAGVGHILHAGDIGLPWILQELERVAPVTAVGGNTDDPALRYAPVKTSNSPAGNFSSSTSSGRMN